MRVIERLGERLNAAKASRLYVLPAWSGLMAEAIGSSKVVSTMRLARGFHLWREAADARMRLRRAHERSAAARREAEATAFANLRQVAQEEHGVAPMQSWVGHELPAGQASSSSQQQQ